MAGGRGRGRLRGQECFCFVWLGRWTFFHDEYSSLAPGWGGGAGRGEGGKGTGDGGDGDGFVVINARHVLRVVFCPRLTPRITSNAGTERYVAGGEGAGGGRLPGCVSQA